MHYLYLLIVQINLCVILGIPSGTVETVLQARCPLSLADTTPGCSGRSDSDLRISTTNITLDTNTTMKVWYDI